MSRVVILHFSPLELYPPVQNLLRVLADSWSKKKVTVITTKPSVEALKEMMSPASNIRIVRLGYSGQQVGLLKKYWTYLFFNIGALAYLLWYKPKSLLYYETISSFPVYLYKKYLNAKVSIFIHYHEYTTTREYAGGMKQTRVFHQKEKWLYPRTVWVSHTNEWRLQQFLRDIAPVVIPNPQELPNYPPKSWNIKGPAEMNRPLRVVYVGALSLQTMYVKEFIEFVIGQNGRMVFDLFTYNSDEETRRYIESQNQEVIRLKAGINYHELPAVLSRYDVGVVLYKGHIDNYIYNAPNKLFEYYTRGLDVWFPQVMTGSIPFITHQTYPKIIPLDFDNLNGIQLDKLVERKDNKYQQELYSSENILAPLIHNLLSDD